MWFNKWQQKKSKKLCKWQFLICWMQWKTKLKEKKFIRKKAWKFHGKDRGKAKKEKLEEKYLNLLCFCGIESEFELKVKNNKIN